MSHDDSKNYKVHLITTLGKSDNAQVRSCDPLRRISLHTFSRGNKHLTMCGACPCLRLQAKKLLHDAAKQVQVILGM